MQNKQPFKGKIFVVTSFSIYCMKFVSPTSTPTVQKVRFVGRSPANVKVTSYLRAKVYWAFTSRGLIPYSAKKGQENPAEHDGPIPLVETLSRRRLGQPTSPVVGLFLKQDDADSCLENVSSGAKQPHSFADEQYHNSTVVVLRAIRDFPLVTFSREGKYALPLSLIQMFDSEY